MTTSAPARLHLLPAKKAPIVVVIRRKPSRLFHIIRVNTKNGTYEQGAWFTGKLYANRCDVSFDGICSTATRFGSASARSRTSSMTRSIGPRTIPLVSLWWPGME